ncbi:MAG: tetratricopeptide repeat protein, partial [Pyrinomonadaceae bacterium]
YLLLTLMIGLESVVGLSRWLDSHRPPADSKIEEEQLYLTGTMAKRISLGFNGLAADWYWMRSLQYVGRKIIDVPDNVPIDNLAQLDLKLLAPLIDTSTTLDPEFIEPYQYAAVVLPAVDLQEAIRLTKKGIAANPGAWRLYQHLGYIYWQQRDFQAAGEAYDQGSKLPGAPPWMVAMKAKMANEGGSRDLAREIYSRMYEQAENANVKEMARKRLLQLDSFDQRDGLRKVLSAYKARVGRCPSSWREIEPFLRALRVEVDSTGAPLDPTGTAYVLTNAGCDLDVDPKSEVPFR